MPEQPIPIYRMPLGAQFLWAMAWKRRPIYLSSALASIVTAILLENTYGLLAGLVPLILLYKAVAHVNATGPSLIQHAKELTLRAGSQRVGITSENVAAFCLATPSGEAPIGISISPEYSLSCVYVTPEYFSLFQGSHVSLPENTIMPAVGGEEIYFRHVTAVTHTENGIHVTVGRGQAVKTIFTGSDPQAGSLIDQLRGHLRKPSPATSTADLPYPVTPSPPPTPRSMGDTERYCYLRVHKLQEYYADPTVIDALLKQLEVPGTAAKHKGMSMEQKRAAIEAQVAHFNQTPTSFWYGVPHQEIIAASVWRSRGAFLSERVVNDRFYDVAREDDLRRPVAKWLRDRGHEPYMEVQLGRRRIDVLGFNPATQCLTAVELKNSDEEFRRGPDQMGSFAEYAHTVYLACTPAFAADYLERNADHRAVNHWDPTLLDRKLKLGGFGLLIVERDAVFELITPVEREPALERVNRVIGGLKAFNLIDLD